MEGVGGNVAIFLRKTTTLHGWSPAFRVFALKRCKAMLILGLGRIMRLYQQWLGRMTGPEFMVRRNILWNI